MIQSTLWLRNFLAGSPAAAEARRHIIDRPRVNRGRYAAEPVHLCSAVRRRRAVLMTKRRNVIVHIGTSVDGYIARPDGELEWLTSRPKPEGFYGMSAFMRSIDTKLLGRKTYEMSLRMGAKFDSRTRNVVFSRHSAPADAPSGVEFVNEGIVPFVSRLREHPGKDIWLMGGGELIASFLDEEAIDEFVIAR